MKIALVQNRILTAESQRTRKVIFLSVGEMPTDKKHSGRRGTVSDPIPRDAGLDQKKNLPQRPPRLCGKPDFEKRVESLFSKQCKKQCQNYTNDYGSDNWKIESKILFSDDDISGESANPRNFFTEQ